MPAGSQCANRTSTSDRNTRGDGGGDRDSRFRQPRLTRGRGRTFEQTSRDDQLLHFGCALVNAQWPDLAIQPFHGSARRPRPARRTSGRRRRSPAARSRWRSFSPSPPPQSPTDQDRAARPPGRSAMPTHRCPWPCPPAWPGSAESRPASGRTSTGGGAAHSASSSARRAKPSGSRRHRCAEYVERRHSHLEALTGLTEALGGRDTTVVEAQASQGVGRDHFDAFGDREPRRGGVDDKRARCRWRPAPRPFARTRRRSRQCRRWTSRSSRH